MQVPACTHQPTKLAILIFLFSATSRQAIHPVLRLSQKKQWDACVIPAMQCSILGKTNRSSVWAYLYRRKKMNEKTSSVQGIDRTVSYVRVRYASVAVDSRVTVPRLADQDPIYSKNRIALIVVNMTQVST